MSLRVKTEGADRTNASAFRAESGPPIGAFMSTRPGPGQRVGVEHRFVFLPSRVCRLPWAGSSPAMASLMVAVQPAMRHHAPMSVGKTMHCWRATASAAAVGQRRDADLGRRWRGRTAREPAGRRSRMAASCS